MSHSASLRRLFDVVDVLVDERLGIVNQVGEWPREAGAPDFFHAYAVACDTSKFGQHENFADAGGASADRGRAFAKAIGEAVERYCSAIYDINDFPLISFDSAPFECVSPGQFALYSLEQYAQSGFPYVPFEDTTLIRWISTIDLDSSESRHVPAAMVFLPYAFDRQHGESAIVQRISTGLACHCSFEEAAISAICEVIERDAFTITWQARLAIPQIRIDSLSEENRDLVRRFERVGDSVSLLDITLEHGIPTIMGVLRGRGFEAPAVVFAASTDLNPEEAARKSLEELAHTRRLAHRLKTTLPPLDPGPGFKDVNKRDHHVHLYCDYANTSLADFIFSSERKIDFHEIRDLSTGGPNEQLNCLVKRIRDMNYQVLIADLTTLDVEELGLKVVRALIPGFHPLCMGHRLRALGGSRLWEVPQKLGYKGITRESGDNPAPHPYP